MSELNETNINPVQDQYLALVGLDDAEYSQAAAAFVHDRVEQLQNEAWSGESIGFDTGNLQGFIGDKTVISPTRMGSGYRLDDHTVYNHIPPLMKTFYNDILSKVGGDATKAYINAAFHTAQYVQQQYFGSVAGDLKARYALDLDIIDDDMPTDLVKSVAEVGTAAVCMERAAIANNTLQILGLKPVLEIGQLTSEKHTKPEDHAYLFVASATGQEYLFDPTNPKLVFDESNNLVATTPSLYPVGDALSVRDPNQPIAGSHVTTRIVDGAPQNTTLQLAFSLGPNGTELHPA